MPARFHFSDILYQLKFRNGQDAKVYVLIEHKSYSDSLVAFQLLRYMIRIWELELNQQSKVRKKASIRKKKNDPTENWTQAKLQLDEEKQAPSPPEESETQKKLALTPILPIIFYHGAQEWRVPLGFQDHRHGGPAQLAAHRSQRRGTAMCSQRRGAAMPARLIFLDLPALLVPAVGLYNGIKKNR